VGHELASADIDRSHKLFGEQLLARVPFVATVVETVRQRKEASAKNSLLTSSMNTSQKRKPSGNSKR
jgi:hypothetical protein